LDASLQKQVVTEGHRKKDETNKNNANFSLVDNVHLSQIFSGKEK
jgi:hypothetical protein